MHILIVGAGAIGGITGGYLTRDGADVVLVDRVEPHVKAMQQHGLRIDGLPGDVLIPVSAALPSEVQGTFDAVFVAVKSQHTADALPIVGAHLAPDGIAVSLQNGLANKELLAQVAGRERTLGAMVRVGGGYQGPGHVRHLTHGLFTVGELDGRLTPRLERLRALLDRVEPTHSTDNLYGWLWAKEVYGCLVVGTALTELTFAEVLDLPGAEPLMIQAMRECARVARAEGVRLEAFDFLDPNALLQDDPASAARTRTDLQTIRERFGHIRSGPWRDIVVRRIPTEVPWTIGEIVEHARRSQVPTPILARLNEMMAEIERGERPMSPANIAELAASSAANTRITP
jgi:2-dehydropantoate 2-reductase